MDDLVLAHRRNRTIVVGADQRPETPAIRQSQQVARAPEYPPDLRQTATATAGPVGFGKIAQVIADERCREVMQVGDYYAAGFARRAGLVVVAQEFELGESPDESLRDVCREAWNVPMVDMYSCQEAGYLALQCPDHPHYHVQSENVLLEVVDDDGRACMPGQVGRVLITSLNNFATPLIRYEIGDYAEVGEPCCCGRGLPVLKRIMGRYRNLLTLPDGTRRWPRLGYESRLQDIAPIELMQMVQRSVEEIDVHLVMPRPLTGEEQENLAKFIRNNLGHPFRLRFEYTDSIRNPANGKIEQFISLIESGR